MTTQILASEPDLILKDGTLVTINEEHAMIWFHPSGKLAQGSYRLNLKLKMVDVVVGADFKQLFCTHEFKKIPRPIWTKIFLPRLKNYSHCKKCNVIRHDIDGDLINP